MDAHGVGSDDGGSRPRCALECCSGTPIAGMDLCFMHAELVTRPLPERLEKRKMRLSLNRYEVGRVLDALDLMIDAEWLRPDRQAEAEEIKAKIEAQAE